MDTRELIARIVPVIERDGHVRTAALFGSFVRGEQTGESDVDLAIDFEEGTSLLDVSGLGLDLEQAAGRRVEIAYLKKLHPYLRDRIMRELQVIYEKR
jgi:hypothetical protein